MLSDLIWWAVTKLTGFSHSHSSKNIRPHWRFRWSISWFLTVAAISLPPLISFSLETLWHCAGVLDLEMNPFTAVPQLQCCFSPDTPSYSSQLEELYLEIGTLPHERGAQLLFQNSHTSPGPPLVQRWEWEWLSGNVRSSLNIAPSCLSTS